MTRALRMLALTGTAAAALALPATAGAAFVSPTSLDFGSVPVGTTSPSQRVVLSADCTSVPISPCTSALLGDFVNVDPTLTGDFVDANGCPAGLSPSLVTGATESCAIDVAFKPSNLGAQVGTLDTGTMGPGGLLPAPLVQLSGTGVSSTGSTSPGTRTRKRCRRHHKKHHRNILSVKKCKKKRRS